MPTLACCCLQCSSVGRLTTLLRKIDCFTKSDGDRLNGFEAQTLYPLANTHLGLIYGQIYHSGANPTKLFFFVNLN